MFAFTISMLIAHTLMLQVHTVATQVASTQKDPTTLWDTSRKPHLSPVSALQAQRQSGHNFVGPILGPLLHEKFASTVVQKSNQGENLMPVEGKQKRCGPCRRKKDCKNGLICRAKRCTMLVSIGDTCGYRCLRCKKGLTCFQGKCYKKQKRNHCGSCSKRSQCAREYVCIRGECRKVVQLGHSCRAAGCTICDINTTCRFGRCVKTDIGACETCVKDSDCYGKGTCRNGKCWITAGLQSTCDQECTVCKSGLLCKDGRCRLMEKNKMLKDKRRETGTKSATKNESKKKNATKKKKERKDKTKSKTKKKMTKKRTTMKKETKTKTQTKTKNKNKKTRTPTQNKKRAKNAHKTKEENDKKRRPDRKLDQRTAKKKPQQECGPCSNHTDCRQGLVCKRSHCAVPHGIGKKCSGKCEACHDGLICKGGVCSDIKLARCAACKNSFQCAKGLSCVNRQCRVLLRKGQPCGDACSACEHALVCRLGVCQRRRTLRCPTCVKGRCWGGRVCKSVRMGEDICAFLVLEGAKCDSECVACADGLLCTGDGVCVNKTSLVATNPTT